MLKKALTVFFIVLLLPAIFIATFRAFKQWRNYNAHVRTGARNLDQVFGPGIGRIYKKESAVSYITFLRATWARE